MHGDDMAGLSSVFIRPRPLGAITTMRGLGYQFSPGVYSYLLKGGGGGGAGGKGRMFIYEWSRYGRRGGDGQFRIGDCYLRLAPTLIEGELGLGGSYISGDANSPGDSGSASSISSIGGPTVVCTGGEGGSATDRTSFQEGYPDTYSMVDPSSYNGRGWGLERYYLNISGSGGSPAGSSEAANGSDGENGDSGLARIGARVG